MRTLLGLFCLLALVVVAGPLRGEKPADKPKEPPRYELRKDHDPNGIGKFYMGREIAMVMGHLAAGWLERPQREREEQPTKLLEALQLKEGDVVADVGAGSGYFTFRMAKKVGAKGKVLAVDIQREMLDIIERRMKALKVNNVEPIQGTETDPKLPAGGVDLILLVDVYHEFSHPYEMTENMVKALKPGGRLVLVEYRLEDPNVPIKLVHKMSEKQAIKEMGPHSLEHSKTIGGLPWQHILVFEKKAAAADRTSKELLQEAARFRAGGQLDQAIEAAGKAVAVEGDNARLYFYRGSLYEEAGKHEQAVADYSACIRLDPKNGLAWNNRGSEQFKLGKIKESVEDFDQFLKLHPENSHSHWKRGISLYYLGRFEDGKKQFVAYEKQDTNDVENAVWHFICNARAVGVEKARGQVLKIGKDNRIPMMRVYELFKGQCKPEDVLAEAQADDAKPELRKQQLFYAHLYLGIYHDILGDRKKALEHLALAAGKYRIGHYMGDVARVHEQLLRREH